MKERERSMGLIELETTTLWVTDMEDQAGQDTLVGLLQRHAVL